MSWSLTRRAVGASLSFVLPAKQGSVRQVAQMAIARLPGFLLAFVLTWALYFMGLALLPASSMFRLVSEAILLQIAFVLLAGAASLATWLLSDRIAARPANQAGGTVVDDDRLRLASRVSLALSGAGVLALFVDKVFVQHIDYLGGLAAARSEWTSLGAERDDISSVWSALGYLTSTSFFVAISVLIVRREIFSATERAIAWLSSFGLALTNSALAGGRSLLLLLAATGVALTLLRADLGKPLPRVRVTGILVFLATIAAVGAYVLYVFAARAELTQIDVHQYSLEMLEFLGGQPTREFERLSGDTWFGLLAGLLVMALAYLVHSAFTFAAIVEAPPQNTDLLFGYLRELAAKLGFTSRPDLDWLLTGRFPSLPGALYLEGGLALLVAGALVLGALMALSVRLCQRYPCSLTALSVWLAVQTTALLSPLLMAAEVLSYPFVIGEFLLIAGVARIADLRAGAVSRYPGSPC